jgi:hypothetical protein
MHEVHGERKGFAIIIGEYLCKLQTYRGRCVSEYDLRFMPQALVSPTACHVLAYDATNRSIPADMN